MEPSGSQRAELYTAYREELLASRMTRHVRMGTLVALVLQTSFVALDWFAYREHFPLFLSVRIALDLILVLIYTHFSRTHPRGAQQALCLSMGAGMLALVYGTNAIDSGYYAGLILVFVGMGVMLPLTGIEAGVICGVLFAGYAAAPLLVDGTTAWGPFGLHLVFLAAAAVECIASSVFLERTRLNDFAQRRQIEKARDELKALDVEKSRFTANVHHELRTPLTLMLAPIEAMLAGQFGDISELQRGYLQSMHTNGLRLLKLINNLLDLAKIESRQLEVRRVPTRLGPLVSQLVAGARPLAERKEIELSARGFEALPAIHVDPEAFDKMVVNLVGNALKFTDPGGRIEVTGEAEPDGGVRLVVRDTGIGLAADQLERIFDRFAQVDSSSTRRHEGTGIGLALVKELVELHGGRIWAESEGLGRGTAMHVQLPYGEADGEADEEVLQTDDGKSVALGNTIAAMQGELALEERNREAMQLSEMRRNVERNDFGSLAKDPRDPTRPAPADAPEVLICEDNADMRRLLSFLVGQEFRVRVAPNGRAGLELLRQRLPDLVLTDVMMPEMSGTELCQVLKSDPKTQGIPVVLVTSKAEREMKIEGLELGADDYVTKPFHPRELMARVRSLVKLRRLQEALAVQNRLLESTNAELQATLEELREAGVQLVRAERLAAVGELAAGVAHEVNNPMNFATNALKTLRSYVQDVQAVAARMSQIDWSDRSALDAEIAELEKLKASLEFEDVTDSLSELVDIVTEGLDRTHRLVADLRDLASPGDGQRAEVDLVRGLQTTAQLAAHNFRERQVALAFRIVDSLPPVSGDARALNQVFLNLLKNAAEALEGRGGTVSVTGRAEPGCVVIEVRDDGPGIPAGDLERIFEPFYSTKGAGRGTGLGLSISRRIVEEHGGTIEAESEPGVGTSFRVALPVREELR
jgi:signal transduction histidine kinase